MKTKEKKMTQAVQSFPQNELGEFDEKKLILIRAICPPDTSEAEFEVFVEICRSTKLNPLFKQIYLIKRGGKASHQVSIDGLRLIADRTGLYAPGREPVGTYNAKGELQSVTAFIKKLTPDGTWHEVGATALYSEYNTKQGLWTKMPFAMTSKCAEAIALRKAFPASMSGLYTADEMAQADVEPKKHSAPQVQVAGQQSAPIPVQGEIAEDRYNPEEPIGEAKAQILYNLMGGDQEFMESLHDFYKIPDLSHLQSRLFEPMKTRLEARLAEMGKR